MYQIVTFWCPRCCQFNVYQQHEQARIQSKCVYPFGLVYERTILIQVFHVAMIDKKHWYFLCTTCQHKAIERSVKYWFNLIPKFLHQCNTKGRSLPKLCDRVTKERPLIIGQGFVGEQKKYFSVLFVRYICSLPRCEFQVLCV